MEIRITDMSIKDAAHVLENLSLIMQNSLSHGDLPSEVYADMMEVMGGIATAIKADRRCAA